MTVCVSWSKLELLLEVVGVLLGRSSAGTEVLLEWRPWGGLGPSVPLCGHPWAACWSPGLHQRPSRAVPLGCWRNGGSAWGILWVLPQDVICCVLNITVLGLSAVCYGVCCLACCPVHGSTAAPSLSGCCCFPKPTSVIQRELRNVTFILLML